MVKVIGAIMTAIFSAAAIGQTDLPVAAADSIKEYFGTPVPIYDDAYMNEYRTSKRLVQKVYPYALYAADLLAEIDSSDDNLEKRRQINKFYKESYKNLKEDFRFFVLDLYTDEGIMLMKLVHRESGMTIYDAAEKYRGKANAEVFLLLGKVFGQDIKVTYDSTGPDKITEHVIRDVYAGIIPIDFAANPMTKEEYKTGNEQERLRIQQAIERNKALLKKRKENEKVKRKKLKEREKQKRKAEKDQGVDKDTGMIFPLIQR
jgi:fructose-specific phosphotransferase system component IIB